MARPYPFICIEGVDGVGKSSVASKVADRIGGRYYKTPPPPYDAIRDEIDKHAPPIARFYFYLSAVAFASNEIVHLCEEAPVVCDRYVYSTIAYHTVMDTRISHDGAGTHLARPDAAFLLVADEAERRARITKRQTVSQALRLMETDDTFLSAVQRRFLGLGLVIVDTNRIDEDAVVDTIVARVTQLPRVTA